MRYITTKHGFTVRYYEGYPDSPHRVNGYLTIGPVFPDARGAAIVCVPKILFHQTGEYAAYMGFGREDSTEEDTVRLVAERGVKIDETLARILFEDALQQLRPDITWQWRR